MTEGGKKTPPWVIVVGDLLTVALAVLPFAADQYRRHQTTGVPLEAVVTFRAAQACKAVAATAGRLGMAAESRYWRCVNRGR